MSFVCARCSKPFDTRMGIVMHGIAKKDPDHEDIQSHDDAWRELFDGEVTRGGGGDSDGDPDPDPPASGVGTDAPESPETAPQPRGVGTDPTPGDNPLLHHESPAERSGGSETCPECGGGMVAQPGLGVSGSIDGQPVSAVLDSDDMVCPSCEVVVTSDGWVIR